MPIPEPRGDESRNDFMSRCISAISDEYPQDQAIAICATNWDNKHKGHSMVETKNLNLEVKAEGRTIIGYAAAFGNVDSYGDIIERGAFSRTLNNNRNRIKTFYNHNTPIGMPKVMVEDDKGLFTESVISQTRTGDEVLALVRDGVISEMSIGYQTIKADFDTDGHRMLKELKLFEFGPVGIAANEQATISGVKALAEAFRDHKNDDDIAAINAAITTLQKLVTPANPSSTPSDPAQATPTDSLDTSWIAEIGDMVHELAEAARA